MKVILRKLDVHVLYRQGYLPGSAVRIMQRRGEQQLSILSSPV